MEAQATRPTDKEPSRSSRVLRARTPFRRLFADRAARWIVTGGGLAIIASILGILVFIVIEVWPLVRGAKVRLGEAGALQTGHVGASVSDEYRSHVAVLSPDGRLRVWRADDGQQVLERAVLEASDGADGAAGSAADPLRQVTVAPGQQLLSAATTDGRVIAVPVGWNVSYVGQDRVVTPEIADTLVFEMDPDGDPVSAFTVRIGEDGSGTAAALLDDGTLVVVRREVEENLFTGEVTESWERSENAAPAPLDLMLLDAEQQALYAGSATGELFAWTLRDGELVDPLVTGRGSPVTALSLLIGDRSLVVGREDGSLAVWFPVRQPDESFVLERIRTFPPHTGAIRLIAPSSRDKGFLAWDDDGRLGLYYSTSHRVLWTGDSPLPEATALFYTPKADGAVIGNAEGLTLLDIHNRHPEVSLKALFARVWYEGYSQPEYTWQSSSATDDFEAKLSLTPLMIGTLKGTLYSLVLAIPLGVLGAMYTSQFMNPGLKRIVKPTVEIMAALPSVVLGFLAGLWLAPRVERIFPALLLMGVLLPLAVLAAGFAWRALPARIRGRTPVGAEALLYMVVLALGIWLCLDLGRPLENFLFDGNYQAWLLETTGLRYDQRNAIVVGLAMGFAVIPIIFSIAEDAFSNVPRNLVAGSLALGANRWQTVTRVVLPTASPGIFSAVMIGFGRAVGETMIVLMATGNTPVLDWNPFNGFRTLSANIAVEIPEAPHGGTLYRTLFLAALILFILTFVINTAAELVRQRLRKRYAEL